MTAETEPDRVGLELRSLNNLIRRHFEFSSHKSEIDRVTGNNGWIISYLGDHPEKAHYQRDIEEYFTITRSTASRVLTLMEQKGLIRRLPVSEDARLKKIVLTEKAWEIREIMLADAMQLERTLTDGFTPEETQILLSYLQRMKENVRADQSGKN